MLVFAQTVTYSYVIIVIAKCIMHYMYSYIPSYSFRHIHIATYILDMLQLCDSILSPEALRILINSTYKRLR